MRQSAANCDATFSQDDARARSAKRGAKELQTTANMITRLDLGQQPAITTRKDARPGWIAQSLLEWHKTMSHRNNQVEGRTIMVAGIASL